MSEASHKRPSEVDTNILIQRLQAGHVDAFEGLFELYSQRVYRQAMYNVPRNLDSELG